MEAGSNCPWNSPWVGKRNSYFISVKGWLGVNGLLEVKLVFKSNILVKCFVRFRFLSKQLERLEKWEISKRLCLCVNTFFQWHTKCQGECMSMSEVLCRCNRSVAVVALISFPFWPKSTEEKGELLQSLCRLWTRCMNSCCVSSSVLTCPSYMSAQAETVHGCVQVWLGKMQRNQTFFHMGYVQWHYSAFSEYMQLSWWSAIEVSGIPPCCCAFKLSGSSHSQEELSLLFQWHNSLAQLSYISMGFH